MSGTDDPRETHVCNEDCPPVGVAGAVPTGQRMPEIRVIPEHYFDVAAEAWASVQGDQIDSLDDQLRAAVTAVVRLDDSAPRVVDVDSLATDEDIYLITARAHADKDLEIIGVPTTAVLLDAAVRRRAADPRHRAVVDAARAPLLAELEQAAEWARSSRDFRERQIRDLAAGRDAARAEAAAIRALHVKERGDLHDEYVDRCAHCTEICAGTILWPCPTIRSLNGDTDG